MINKPTTKRTYRFGSLLGALVLSTAALTACGSDASDTTEAAATEAVETTIAAESVAAETVAETAAATEAATEDSAEVSEAALGVETTEAAEHAHGDAEAEAAHGDAEAGHAHGADAGAATETTVAFDTTVLANGAASKVVASTSWVAAVAKMAGATNISVLAPNNVVHPPDYDPKPSDLTKIEGADLVLLAGFEGFAKRMTEAAGSTARVNNVALMYDPAVLGPEVLKFASILGTTDAATANVAAYTAAYKAASDGLKAKLGSTTQVVVAQAFAAEWAAFAGWTPAGTFGPQPLTAGDIAELSGKKPTVVLENSHMPGGKPIADAAGAKFVSLVNFPGDDLDLVAVVKKNADAIAAALVG